MEEGWICPKCGSVWSPDTSKCKKEGCDGIKVVTQYVQVEQIVVDKDGNQLLKS